MPDSTCWTPGRAPGETVDAVSLSHDLHSLLGHYGYATVAAGLFLEHFGLPLPGESLLIAMAVLASRGYSDIALLLACAWLGATLGNAGGFAVGRYAGRRFVLRHGSRIGITETRFAKVEAKFDRWGDIVLVGARFVVLLRQLSGIAAGTLGMGWGRFMILNALGAAIWVGWWGLAAYWAGDRIFALLTGAAGFELGLAALVVSATLWLFLRAHRRRRARRSITAAQ
ncbi:MAG TPA: DedA family protein [Stellaceae bacterium]|nr:DedA family protein [Stellaceae bacterium]